VLERYAVAASSDPAYTDDILVLADAHEELAGSLPRGTRGAIKEVRRRRKKIEAIFERARGGTEPHPDTFVHERELGRNEPCWCGSGRKYKRCHWSEDRA
jgi:uncharacterized protein YecA (UPF0149 family)